MFQLLTNNRYLQCQKSWLTTLKCIVLQRLIQIIFNMKRSSSPLDLRHLECRRFRRLQSYRRVFSFLFGTKDPPAKTGLDLTN